MRERNVGTRGWEEKNAMWWMRRGRAINLDGGVVEKIYLS